ncbi:SIS domain-containing protein [Streptomyces sp. NPDC094149]|uniref:SIS domain-containing protein n=1 Tax=Streptomyces sp. NPDC094149 TaxID=3155079 RepID=UPI003325361D
MALEIDTQPETWREAARLATEPSCPLPAVGQRVAVVGCGTSWFMAQAYAALRESLGHGVTDAFAASEARLLDRAYDSVVVISRSGTTTEVLQVLDEARGRIHSVAVVGDPDSPMTSAADAVVRLPFADERSVVQTRFATTALTLLRAHLGRDVTESVTDAEEALRRPIDDAWITAEQFSFLGLGWTVGLANEAALKLRESSQSWTEAYPAMEYRHGPIAIAAPGRITWMFGAAPDGLADEVNRTGALFVQHDADPLAELVLVQRVALERARARGLDADAPRNLSRSVILEDPTTPRTATSGREGR